MWQLLVRLGKVATQEMMKKRDFTGRAKEDEEGGEAVAISVGRSAAARHALAGDDRRTEVADVAEVVAFRVAHPAGCRPPRHRP